MYWSKRWVEWKQTVGIVFSKTNWYSLYCFRFWGEWSLFQFSSATWWREKVFSIFFKNDVTFSRGHFLRFFTLTWNSKVIWPVMTSRCSRNLIWFFLLLSSVIKSRIVRKRAYSCRLIWTYFLFKVISKKNNFKIYFYF